MRGWRRAQAARRGHLGRRAGRTGPSLVVAGPVVVVDVAEVLDLDAEFRGPARDPVAGLPVGITVSDAHDISPVVLDDEIQVGIAVAADENHRRRAAGESQAV